MNLDYPNFHGITKTKWEEAGNYQYQLITRKKIDRTSRYTYQKYKVDNWLINADWDSDTQMLNGFTTLTYRCGDQQHTGYAVSSPLGKFKIKTTYPVFSGIIKNNVMHGFGRFGTRDGLYSIEAFFNPSNTSDTVNDSNGAKNKEYPFKCQVEFTPTKISLTGRVKIFKKGNILWYEGNIADNFLTGIGTFYDDKGNIQYEGEVWDGKCSGEGKKYQNKKVHFQGKFIDNWFVDGTIFDVKTYFNHRPIFIGEVIYKIDKDKRTIDKYKGTYLVNNETTYHGIFNANFKQYGEGTRYARDTLTADGIFENGILKKGKFYFGKNI